MNTKKDEDLKRLSRLRKAAKTEPVSSFLNMKLVKLSHGYAKVTLQIRPEHQTFNGFTFGGIIMALADQAFAYGSNSVITPNIAVQFNIHFIDKAEEKDKLIAECHVIREGRRFCVSEITVHNQSAKLIAAATGTTIPILKQ
jgi:phenylacetic acid degradation protein PaaD